MKICVWIIKTTMHAFMTEKNPQDDLDDLMDGEDTDLGGGAMFSISHASNHLPWKSY